uniref:Ig-like domain-containing protein n=1 Tax=Oreochromis aureus TaxID=47969 RepID=A0AAZ1WYD0_OREAU
MCCSVFKHNDLNMIHSSGRGTIVVVSEGNYIILPCSLSSQESLVRTRFDWKKDDEREVFVYDAGLHHNNRRSGQDEHFRGRVSHLSDQLKFGNASIIIRNTKVADSGDYTCDFPFHQPDRETVGESFISAIILRSYSNLKQLRVSTFSYIVLIVSFVCGILSAVVLIAVSVCFLYFTV